MIDFFDEDFPLTKKQEELEKKKLAEEEAKRAALEAESEDAKDELPEEDVQADETMPEETAEEISDEAFEEESYFGELDPASEEQDREPYEDDSDIDSYFEDESSVEAEEIFEQPADDFEEEIEPEVAEPLWDELILNDEPDAVISFSDESDDEVEVAEPVFDEEEKTDEAPISIAEEDADRELSLHEELRRLVEKLDNMERAVDSLEQSSASVCEPGFSYEYDERYFAEEETPAYKHPELYKKEAPAPVKKTQAKPKKDNSTISINTKTLLKVGALVAATAAAVKLLDRKDDK